MRFICHCRGIITRKGNYSWEFEVRDVRGWLINQVTVNVYHGVTLVRTRSLAQGAIIEIQKHSFFYKLTQDWGKKTQIFHFCWISRTIITKLVFILWELNRKLQKKRLEKRAGVRIRCQNSWSPKWGEKFQKFQRFVPFERFWQLGEKSKR